MNYAFITLLYAPEFIAQIINIGWCCYILSYSINSSKEIWLIHPILPSAALTWSMGVIRQNRRWELGDIDKPCFHRLFHCITPVAQVKARCNVA